MLRKKVQVHAHFFRVPRVFRLGSVGRCVFACIARRPRRPVL